MSETLLPPFYPSFLPTALCPFYGLLSPLRPSVLFTAFCPPTALCLLCDRMSLRQASISSKTFCPFYALCILFLLLGPLCHLPPSVPSTTLCLLYCPPSLLYVSLFLLPPSIPSTPSVPFTPFRPLCAPSTYRTSLNDRISVKVCLTYGGAGGRGINVGGNSALFYFQPVEIEQNSLGTTCFLLVVSRYHDAVVLFCETWCCFCCFVKHGAVVLFCETWCCCAVLWNMVLLCCFVKHVWPKQPVLQDAHFAKLRNKRNDPYCFARLQNTFHWIVREAGLVKNSKPSVSGLDFPPSSSISEFYKAFRCSTYTYC